MSNPDKHAESECKELKSAGVVELIVDPVEKDLGGFTIRRSLPSALRRTVGPWVFFDHMGPAEFAPGPGVDVRPHPHIGLATVTYLFEGEMLHRDSLGSEQVIVPGDINLMVAGKGIVHSEREQPHRLALLRKLNGLQLWLALPEQHETIEPAFFHHAAKDIPQVYVNHVKVRVLMGEAYGVSSPVKLYSDTLLLKAHLEAGQSLTLPEAEERAVYVVHGELSIGDLIVPEHSMAFLKKGETVTVQSLADTRIALVGGESFSRRYLEWNFVASNQELIERAKSDWKAGRFAKVPGDEHEFIPLPE